ncbi:MAG: DUF2829 domain-containing protein [Peptostreptococcaceae bacterium]
MAKVVNNKDIVITVKVGIDMEFCFGVALEYLKKGYKVTKSSWHKEGMYLSMQTPDKHSKMKGTYLYITIGDYLNPWTPTQADMLEEDWVIYEK